MDTPLWYALPFAVLAVGMLVLFITKREALQDVYEYQNERLFGRPMPGWLSRGGTWFNVLAAGIIAVVGIAMVVTAVV